jgi:putative aldouronate transport system substrate-binding protein
MTPVKTEVANCQAVIDELYYAVALGSVDPDEYQPKLVAKLKAAGSEKIVAEKQKQIDEWKAENK